MFCGYCGKEIPDNSLFCGYCGKSLQSNQTNNGISKEPNNSGNETKTARNPLLPLIWIIAAVSITVFIAVAIFVIFYVKPFSRDSKDYVSDEDQVVEETDPQTSDENESQTDLDIPQEDEEPSFEEDKAPSADDLIDKFVRGDISVEGPFEGKDSFNISDLQAADEEWLRYEVGDRVDVDNDGENELIMEGPYGGMILDARDGKIVVLTEGEGTAGVLSYTQYEGSYWIVHSDTSHGGREIYELDKYNGEGKIIESAILSAEYWDDPDDRYDENSAFSFRDNAISMKEFDSLKAELFGHNESQEGSENADYIFPDSANRLLTEEDLEGLSTEELRRGRNEIAARHGRLFKDSDLQEYFDSKSWYKGIIDADEFNKKVKLSDIENRNMEFIKEHENGE